MAIDRNGDTNGNGTITILVSSGNIFWGGGPTALKYE
jgi:hypothetical protein